MKNIIAISFLLLFLSTNTAFGQLLRLPVLIQHYHLHNDDTTDSHRDFSILDFLSEHYGGECNHSHKQNNNQDHKSLPFHNASSIASSNNIVIPDFHKITIPRLIITEKAKHLFAQRFYSSAYLEKIWQPPRLS